MPRRRCYLCRAFVRRIGLAVAGGHAVIITRCPRCDRYRKEDDR